MSAPKFCPCEDKGGCHCWQKGYDVALKYQSPAPVLAMGQLLATIRQTYVPDGDAAREIETVLDEAGLICLLPNWCDARGSR